MKLKPLPSVDVAVVLVMVVKLELKSVMSYPLLEAAVVLVMLA